jgi:AcrR family transcriptional regulator
MPFGKPGRPPLDRLAEQQRIYEATTPLLQASGVRGLSMRAVADAACLSVGGLYHYFPNKRALVLHGLRPEARDRLCRDFRARIADAPAAAGLDAYLDLSVRLLAFVRPAVQAALELGAPTLQAELDAGLAQNAAELQQALALAAPHARGRRPPPGAGRARRRPRRPRRHPRTATAARAWCPRRAAPRARHHRLG